MPKEFLQRLFKDKIQFEKKGEYDEIARLPCRAEFKLQFKINGFWFRVSESALIKPWINNGTDLSSSIDNFIHRPENPWCDARFSVNTNGGTSYVYYGNPFWFHVCMTTNDPQATPVYNNNALYKMGHATKIGLAQKTKTNGEILWERYFE
jgi:hypothetical protein